MTLGLGAPSANADVAVSSSLFEAIGIGGLFGAFGDNVPSLFGGNQKASVVFQAPVPAGPTPVSVAVDVD